MPELSAEFVWQMEDVLDLYARPYDPEEPVICFDETSKQLVADVTPPTPAAPGQPARYDYEYQRNGTRNLFLWCEPLQGVRHLEVTEHRCKADVALQLQALVDDHYPTARRIHLVWDHLNVHTPAVLYEVYPPEEAKRIADRLQVHYTPKHGSWLNQAEIEFAILTRQCLDRRIPDAPTLEHEVAAWEDDRNERRTMIKWLFNVHDARTRLASLYPVTSSVADH